jgi:protein-disulfide isomerase
MRRTRLYIFLGLLTAGSASACTDSSEEIRALRERNAWLEQQQASLKIADSSETADVVETPDVVTPEDEAEASDEASPALAPARRDVETSEEVARREQLEALSRDAQTTAATLAALAERITRLERDVLEAKAKPSVRPGRPDPALRYRVELADANLRGPSDAKVTVVIFSDFQCPFCERVNKTLAEVGARYKDDVRFAFKHNPLAFHKDALPAAKAAEAAGAQGKFWEKHDLLFQHRSALTNGNFLKWARQLGLDTGSFRKALNDAGLAARIASHQAEAMRVGARGTPAFFINGRFLSGAQPLKAFQRVIDEELKVADQLIAGGTERSAVYTKLMKDARSGV